MFISFLYLLRARRLKVSLNEWLALTAALDRGLCGASLLDFYHLCKSLLVKSETDYDKFDLAFAEYFEGVSTPKDIPDEIWKWLYQDVKTKDINDKNMLDDHVLELEELQNKLKERIEEQKDKHDGGNYWIGTGGTSTMGYNGYHEKGIRVGGESRHKNAVQIASERNYKDFRQDNILDIRQFQLAFRRLRQYSSRLDGSMTELDIDGTINETCNNAGNLRLVWQRPRKNTVKLLLLFDSDGSMMPYSRICSQLFQAVSKSNHFKDLKVYYFHNCIYEHLYTTPNCRRGEWIDTDWVLSNISSEYKVIFVGDAFMAPSELMSKGGNCIVGLYNEIPGIDWMKRFKNKYANQLWLNPIPERRWGNGYGGSTLLMIKELFPMQELTVDGLETGIKKLLASR